MTPSDQTELRQKLAAIEHERWSDWQKYCHGKLRQYLGSQNIALETLLARWEKQIATPYPDLSDQERASDMEQVDRYWPLIEAYVAAAEQRAVLQFAKMSLTDKIAYLSSIAHSNAEDIKETVAELEQSLRKEQE